MYFYILNFIINFLKLFVKKDDKLILFNSFGGRKYDDSPKEIFENMVSDFRFEDYKFVWAFDNPEKFDVKNAKKIKTDSLVYFITALKARCWITNSSVERGLNFKQKHTYYFNTWHGTPIKKMGTDISTVNTSFRSKKNQLVDNMTAQGDYEAQIFSNVFNVAKEKFLLCGLPRNDILSKYDLEDKEKIKRKLGIPLNKKVILYAPTFREYKKDSANNCLLYPPHIF